jgi:hypothetical protein
MKTLLFAFLLFVLATTAPKSWSQTYTDAVAVMREVDDQFTGGKRVCHDYAVKMVMLMDAKWPGSSYIFCAVDGVGFDGAWALKGIVSTNPLPQSENVKTGTLTDFNGKSKWVKADIGLNEKKISEHSKAHTWVIVRTTDFGLVQFDPTWSDNRDGINRTSVELWNDVHEPWSDGTNRFFYATNLKNAALFAANLEKTTRAQVAVYWPEKDKVAICLTDNLQGALGYWKNYGAGSYKIVNGE